MKTKLESQIIRRRKAFTLIELLVVVAIIGILAGMLLPVLNQSREKGRSAKCIANLKQIGLAMGLYGDDYGYYPYGLWSGVTQWDICVGPYAGGQRVQSSPLARGKVFLCPSVKVSNSTNVVNYSSNPTICKDYSYSLLTKYDSLARPFEVIVAADSIQYKTNGIVHAMFWGMKDSSGADVSQNSGSQANAEKAVQLGADKDQALADTNATGANLRYRHAGQTLNALFADGHVGIFRKGQVLERNVYSNY